MKEIKVTNKYDQFKRLEGNRDTDSRRVDKIKKSIQKVGYITSPILVNEKMEIIDGQGRFEALKELQLPIEYIVQKNIGVKECIAMNVYQTNWKQTDYIRSYAERGIQSYVYIQEIMERFKINNIALISVATLGVGRFDPKATRTGRLEITQEQYENAVKKLDFFKYVFEKYSDVKRVNLFLQGLLYSTTIEGIDLERLKEKSIEVLEYGKLPPIPTIEEVMQFIEELYNKNSKRPTLYIYTEYRKQVEERIVENQRTLHQKGQAQLHKYMPKEEVIKEV